MFGISHWLYVYISNKDGPIVIKDGEGGDTPPSTGAPTTQSTGDKTTVKPNSSSSLTSPNKVVMGVAGLLTLLYYVKFYETY